MRRYIVDTSVAVKWFSEFDENDLETALSLRYQVLERKCSIVVLDLFFYEIANALRYNPNFSETDIKKAVSTLFEMDFEVKVIEPTAIVHTIELAMRNNVIVYDACFLALSKLELMESF